MTRHICIVTPETDEEKVSEATRWAELARHLAEDPSLRVTLLHAGEHTADGRTPAAAKLDFARQGVEYCSAGALPPLPGPLEGCQPFHGVSFRIAQFLTERRFDAVLFQDRMANGFVSLQARRSGLALQDTQMAVAMTGPSQWRNDTLQRWSPRPLEEGYRSWAERFCCERADLLVSCDAALFDWADTKGWSLAERREVVPAGSADAAAGAWKELLTAPEAAPVGAPDDRQEPGVAVCMAHYNQGKLLPEAVRSIAAGGYGNLDIVVVDDGSTDEGSQTVLNELAESRADCTVMRKENQGQALARNYGVAHSRSDYIVFFDADNIARPHMVERLVAAIQHTGADCVTCAMEAFTPENSPRPTPEGGYAPPGAVAFCYLPLGPCLEMGWLNNVFGDLGCIVRRSAFEALGGFKPGRAAFEDWEFFARLCLQGYTLAVLPEPLFWYRLSEGSTSSTRNEYEGRRRIVDAYREFAPFVGAMVENTLAPLCALVEPQALGEDYRPEYLQGGEEAAAAETAGGHSSFSGKLFGRRG